MIQSETMANLGVEIGSLLQDLEIDTITPEDCQPKSYVFNFEEFSADNAEAIEQEYLDYLQEHKYDILDGDNTPMSIERMGELLFEMAEDKRANFPDVVWEVEL